MRPVLALALLALLFVSPFAAPDAVAGRHSGRNAKPKAPPKPQYEALTAVDRATGTVTITMMNGTSSVPHTYRVNQFTEIEVNGRRGTFADLTTGMKVTHGLGTDPTFLSRLVLSPAPPDPVAPAKSRGGRKKAGVR